MLSPLFPFCRGGSLGCPQKAVMSCFSSSPGFQGETCVFVGGKEKDAEQRAMLLPCVCLQVTCCPAVCWHDDSKQGGRCEQQVWGCCLQVCWEVRAFHVPVPVCFARVYYPQHKENQRNETFSLLGTVLLSSHIKTHPIGPILWICVLYHPVRLLIFQIHSAGKDLSQGKTICADDISVSVCPACTLLRQAPLSPPIAGWLLLWGPTTSGTVTPILGKTMVFTVLALNQNTVSLPQPGVKYLWG